MDTKILLTTQFLRELGLPITKETIKKYLHLWWKNPRLNGDRSFSMTDIGFNLASQKIGLKFYRINLFTLEAPTNQLIIWLDKFIDCPYYFTEDYIMVSKEKVAVQLILFDGDLFRFGKAKEISQKNR
jgi:hypothetical protein